MSRRRRYGGWRSFWSEVGLGIVRVRWDVGGGRGEGGKRFCLLFFSWIRNMYVCMYVRRLRPKARVNPPQYTGTTTNYPQSSITPCE